MFQKNAGIPVSGYDQALLDVKQRDPGRRANGVANLGVWGTAEAVPVAKGFLQDESEAVRVAAQFALALLGDAEMLPKLIAHLADERHEFRKRAAVALLTVTGAGIACDHADAASCASAKKDYESWLKKHDGKLKWDPKKKTFGEGAAGEAKAKKK